MRGDRAIASTPDDVDLARAHQYSFLAGLLRRTPSRDLVSRIGRLAGDESPLGRAYADLASAARRTNPNSLNREFTELFVGVGRGEIVPYASYYMTGFLLERPLVKLRGDLAILGLTSAEWLREPEDHIAVLCEIMAGLASRQFSSMLLTQRSFFERHLFSWAPQFFSDLESAKSARFYRAVAKVGSLFVEIEAQAFAMESRTSAETIGHP
ncbi:molecular chaperone TorD family protein (plasmid) [Microvirga terrae]|uniref:Molecular chaperone TorD family protein n=1 Tax=Microvirga terrae TaxID=2740529 RepID=A0ABY5RY34_9HYPH|nr:molecular chaperone TorD family protein [Microvirga terrae]UVF22175.1 molecular chaperone TorD family protein [Microvirga terrae]